MNFYTVVAILLILAGIAGLVYGQFSYTKETHEAQVGPLELSVKDQKTVDIPVWLGAGAVVVGAGMLVFRIVARR